ncbi:TetR/AcrR family transcriptional regulator [Cellulophaga baltica]|uniref:TetR/AcrR family transcriptional regulator n=1 Tax=Cellulophaga baltica TaxID=76594 RepID=UPI002494CB0F|nr:TetR/AcrR family transcriptional regulator [Cellulophaga baltica]
MRPQKVQDTEIMISLVKTFRSKGYEGTSLAELAESTGLKKASLYHRFPKGKQEMATAVLDFLEEWVDQHLFTLLLDENKSPEARIKEGIAEIRKSYDHGKETCIFRALSLGQSLELFEVQIHRGMSKWINAFKNIGIALGLTVSEAQQQAVDTLIKIQGSLIVTRGMNDLAIFETTLQEIQTTYLKP